MQDVLKRRTCMELRSFRLIRNTKILQEEEEVPIPRISSDASILVMNRTYFFLIFSTSSKNVTGTSFDYSHTHSARCMILNRQGIGEGDPSAADTPAIDGGLGGGEQNGGRGGGRGGHDKMASPKAGPANYRWFGSSAPVGQTSTCQ